MLVNELNREFNIRMVGHLVETGENNEQANYSPYCRIRHEQCNGERDKRVHDQVWHALRGDEPAGREPAGG
jgi:hypothetical protein